MGGTQRGESVSGNGCSKRNLNNPTWEDIFTMDNRPRKFCLELFAGTARITSALRKAGLQCFPIDTCIFRSHIVLHASVEHSIQHFLRSGRVQLVWLGMPCTTFSRARRNDGLGPGPLRTTDAIWGLQGLNQTDQRKLRDGNALFLFTLRIVKLCQSLHIPYVIENPDPSMAWDMPPMRSFMQSVGAKTCQLDFCMFGAKWEKPTRLAYNFLDLDSLNIRCCSSNHICCRTHRPHLPLKGRASSGQFWTLIAQPYPWQLAAAFSGIAAKALCG